MWVTFNRSIKKIWNTERERYLYYVKKTTPDAREKPQGAFGSIDTYEYCIDLADPDFAIQSLAVNVIGKKIKSNFSAELPQQERDVKTEVKVAQILYPQTTQYGYTIAKDSKYKIESAISLFLMPNLGEKNLYDYRETEAFKKLSFLDRINGILRIAVQIQTLHKKGYAHLDLKDYNIVCDSKTGIMSLTDFGIARKIGKRDKTGGTIGYLPPEATQEFPLISIARDTFPASAVFAVILGASADAVIAQRDTILKLNNPFNFDSLPRDLLYREKIVEFLKKMSALYDRERPSDETVIEFFSNIKYQETIKSLNCTAIKNLITDEKKRLFYSLFTPDCSPHNIDTGSLNYKIYEALLEKHKNTSTSIEIYFGAIKPFITCPYLCYLEKYLFNVINQEIKRLEKAKDGDKKGTLLRQEAEALKEIIINAVKANQQEESSLATAINAAVCDRLKNIIKDPVIDKNRREIQAFFKKLLGVFLAVPLLGIPMIFTSYRYCFFYNETQDTLRQIRNEFKEFPTSLAGQKNIVLTI